MAILRCQRYPDEHYLTLFNPDTGFFVRSEYPGHEEPFWSAHGPEMLDISITSWCSRECKTCYRAADRNGYHMSLSDYESIIHQAAQLGTTQVALGGGNPNEHPRFAEILRLTRHDYGIVPNYTTNGRGLSEDTLRVSKECCGAVAVSAYEPYSDLEETILKLRLQGVRTNVHFVLDAQSADTALAWLKDPPEFLSNVNAIVFLNYKPVGRGARQDRLLRHSYAWRELIEIATSRTLGFKVGFDSCIVSGLLTTGRIDPIWFDSCEAARFTMFVSETLQAYPCSFMESIHPGISLKDVTLLDAWQNGTSFVTTRRKLQSPQCVGCLKLPACRGGCPSFPQINLCDASMLTGVRGSRQAQPWKTRK